MLFTTVDNMLPECVCLLHFNLGEPTSVSCLGNKDSLNEWMNAILVPSGASKYVHIFKGIITTYTNDIVYLYTHKSSATVQTEWTKFPQITE